MANLSLAAEIREVSGKKVHNLRTEGLIPAVLYGHKTENKNLVVKVIEFAKTFEAAGESTLIDLKVGQEKPVTVLIHDVQHDHLSNQIIHVDFYQVRMDEKITATVHLKLLGEAPAVKELGGILVTSMEHLEIKCLPGDLIKEIVVDLSGLKSFGDKILVKDLQVSDKVEVLAPAEASVISVAQPRMEEEAPAAAPAEEVATPEVAAEEKTETAEE
jgi:large subunit ribosomal protein L25